MASSAKTVDALRAIQRRIARDPGEASALDALRRELHRVRGTAGSYGFAEASRLAAELEPRAAQWAADPAHERAERSAVLERFVDALADALRAPGGPEAGAGATASDASGGFARGDEWRGLTVLAVDDDPMVLVLVRALFTGTDVEVDTLDDPAGLDAAIEARPPSLVVLDNSMPGASGIELTRRLRARAPFRELPIILLSGSTDPETRSAALEAGADEFVAKPIAPVELRARIADRLARQRLARLSAGLHPATALPLADRLSGDADRALAHLAERALSALVVMVHPVDPATGGPAAGAWIRETARLARELTPQIRAAGYTESLALCLVLSADVEPATARLRELAAQRPERAPSWVAGLAPAGSDAGRTFRDLRRAAEDALDHARREPDHVVRAWNPADALQAPDVILVEDDPALAGMIEYAMQSAGVTFRSIDNGMDALEQLLRYRTVERHPIVLLDVDLPGLDGYSLYDRLSAERPDAYDVVFMTVHGAEADQIRALRAGAMDYLPKPVNLRVLMAKLSTWLQRARRPT
ncbi:MAG: response regulator [Gemmatimonadota bacterium]|nr:response regulator [Gemmatimonadota bacterium]